MLEERISPSFFVLLPADVKRGDRDDGDPDKLLDQIVYKNTCRYETHSLVDFVSTVISLSIFSKLAIGSTNVRTFSWSKSRSALQVARVRGFDSQLLFVLQIDRSYPESFAVRCLGFLLKLLSMYGAFANITTLESLKRGISTKEDKISAFLRNVEHPFSGFPNELFTFKAYELHQAIPAFTTLICSLRYKYPMVGVSIFHQDALLLSTIDLEQLMIMEYASSKDEFILVGDEMHVIKRVDVLDFNFILSGPQYSIDLVESVAKILKKTVESHATVIKKDFTERSRIVTVKEPNFVQYIPEQFMLKKSEELHGDFVAFINDINTSVDGAHLAAALNVKGPLIMSYTSKKGVETYRAAKLNGKNEIESTADMLECL